MFNQYPYQNYNDANLDPILQALKEVKRGSITDVYIRGGHLHVVILGEDRDLGRVKGDPGKDAQPYDDTEIRTKVNELSESIHEFSTYVKKPFKVPTINLIYGYVRSDGTMVSDNTYYKRTTSIFLKSGETIRAYGCGSASVWLMSEWLNGRFVTGIMRGDNQYHIYEHTADHDEYIVICGQTRYVNNNAPILSDDELKDIIIFEKDEFYNNVKESPLYGKRITLMGDSLAHGSITGNDCVWLHHLALKYNMIEHNLGINGSAFTQGCGSGTPMCERYAQIPESDIIVVEGGANDKNDNAPIGTVSDTTPTTFAGAVYTVINGIRSMYPKSKIVFLTDYNRYPSRWAAYVDMMKNVCARYSVPCFDNFAESGIDLISEGTKAWQDEGFVLSGSANVHISPEAYKKVLLPKYEAFLIAQ